MNQWYVLKTKPHREDSVSTLLLKANIQTLNPKLRHLHHRTSGSQYRSSPLFPSYLFLNIDFGALENIHLIKYTRGVSKILCAQNKPIALANEIIQTIVQRMDPDGFIKKQNHLKRGDSIRVKKGILKDLVGILEKPSSDDEGRVMVLLNLVNYNLKASLHWSEIEKMEAA